jgi:hypothetical protein
LSKKGIGKSEAMLSNKKKRKAAQPMSETQTQNLHLNEKKRTQIV